MVLDQQPQKLRGAARSFHFLQCSHRAAVKAWCIPTGHCLPCHPPWTESHRVLLFEKEWEGMRTALVLWPHCLPNTSPTSWPSFKQDPPPTSPPLPFASPTPPPQNLSPIQMLPRRLWSPSTPQPGGPEPSSSKPQAPCTFVRISSGFHSVADWPFLLTDL